MEIVEYRDARNLTHERDRVGRDQARPTLKTNFFDTVAFTETMLPLVRR